ncbi:geranylgeranyl transferase type-1 subunit beta-like, partial [Stegodyphus dumicola]|uniref:geranylgeranyl transferase type-1 subunit beta-like n=1 Tax=Stegodyphus dumicola TaxID=202533 RepID=UPI0015ACC3C1
LVVAFFAVSALDHLDALIKINSEKEKLIDWLYTFQVQPEKNESSPNDYGFRSCTTCSSANSSIYDKPHAALTYAALCTLIILGDDLSRVDKKNIVTSLRKLQLPDGSFRPMNVECESDMRFVYCAACICYILQDWSGMDVEKTVAYIKLSRNYDGGIGQGPGLESHENTANDAEESDREVIENEKNLVDS